MAAQAHAVERGLTWVSPPCPPGLRGLVRSRHAYRMPVPAGTRHVAMPQPFLPLILSLGPEHHIRDPRDGSEVVVDSFVAGLTEATSLVGGPAFAGVQVDLSPIAARRLLGGAVADLRDHSVHVGDVLGPAAVELQDRLRATAGWHGRIALVDRWLQRRLGGPDDLAPELARAWRLLHTSGGRARIGAVAADVGWSARHLRRRFRAAFGLGPKAAARVVRLDRTWQVLRRDADADLASVAATHGYADQAHFANEVREMTGFTPTQLVDAQRGRLGALVADSSKPASLPRP